MKDQVMTRMKENYESRTQSFLPRRAFSIIRLDGKAFHSYSKNLKKPFDDGLMNDMDETAIYLCKNIQGAKFAFVQSDEISILMTDFEKIETDAWFDGNIQKICSISASMATSKFNQLRTNRFYVERYNNGTDQINWTWFLDAAKLKQAEFDSRVFTVPAKSEVANYFIARQRDTIRNSVSSVAQSIFSHNELNGKNVTKQQEMVLEMGINWDDYAIKYKQGRFIEKQELLWTLPANDDGISNGSYLRSKWLVVEPPVFTIEKDFLMSRIPDNL